MENQQFEGYNDIFAKTLRKLMDENPRNGEKVTQKMLADYLNTSTQSISYYKNGDRQPNMDTLRRIAEYFGVSMDYLATGVSAQNKALHKELGLSEEAVNCIKRAHDTGNFENCTDVITVLNSLLSDKDFYAFLEDLTFKAESLKALMNQTEEEKRMRPAGINMEGYFSWNLQTFINEYIERELKKRGLSLKEK